MTKIIGRYAGLAAIALATATILTTPASASSHHHRHYMSAGGYSQGTACGLERWSIKTLADAGAPSPSGSPRVMTVSALDALQGPADPDSRPTSRFAPVEDTLFGTRAYLVGYRVENDSDYHLELRDPQSGATLVAEIPAPYCTARYANVFAAARAAVDRIGQHTATQRWWWLDYHGATPPLVEVYGFGFWDREHGQTGAAPNNFEIHPAIEIRPL